MSESRTPTNPNTNLSPAQPGPARDRREARRIQRSRAKGYRLPENAVFVGRPSRWGNPWRIKDAAAAAYGDGRQMAVYAYREWLRGNPDWNSGDLQDRRQRILNDLPELRGRDLACFCPEGQACHADVLLELANAPPAAPARTEE